jgi:hypothetical protein
MVDVCKGLLVLVLASISASPSGLRSQDDDVDVLLIVIFGREHQVAVESCFRSYVLSYLSIQQLHRVDEH